MVLFVWFVCLSVGYYCFCRRSLLVVVFVVPIFLWCFLIVVVFVVVVVAVHSFSTLYSIQHTIPQQHTNTLDTTMFVSKSVSRRQYLPL